LNSVQIKDLCLSSELQQKYNYERTIETHISWILLCEKYVFKIKKPVKYEFLDYSDVLKRALYCHKEVNLNNRFAIGIYLKVIPITYYKKQFKLNGTVGEIAEYAIMMKRLDENFLLSNLLKKNKIDELNLLHLSKYVYKIHKESEIHHNFNVNTLAFRLNQVLNLKNIIHENIGNDGLDLINKVIDTSNLFLEKHKSFLKKRAKQSHVRIVHGDLHSENIFIEGEIINFIDCIEFEENYMKIDLLDDIASILVDFDFYNKENFGIKFLQQYASFYRTSHHNPMSTVLLNYYKMQRSVTRFSVCLLTKSKVNLNDAKKYYSLLKNYETLVIKGLCS